MIIFRHQFTPLKGEKKETKNYLFGLLTSKNSSKYLHMFIKISRDMRYSIEEV